MHQLTGNIAGLHDEFIRLIAPATKATAMAGDDESPLRRRSSRETVAKKRRKLLNNAKQTSARAVRWQPSQLTLPTSGIRSGSPSVNRSVI